MIPPCDSYLLLAADKLVPKTGALIPDSLSLRRQQQSINHQGERGSIETRNDSREGGGLLTYVVEIERGEVRRNIGGSVSSRSTAGANGPSQAGSSTLLL